MLSFHVAAKTVLPIKSGFSGVLELGTVLRSDSQALFGK